MAFVVRKVRVVHVDTKRIEIKAGTPPASQVLADLIANESVDSDDVKILHLFDLSDRRHSVEGPEYGHERYKAIIAINENTVREE